MKLTSISEFLNGKISAPNLLTEAAAEIAAHEAKLFVQGSSAPVFLEGDTSLTVSKHHIRTLVDAVMQEDIRISELEYIANIILMYDGFAFEDETVEDCAFELSDQVANGPLTPRRLLEIQRRLF